MSVLQKPDEHITVVQSPYSTLDTRNVSEFRDTMQSLHAQDENIVLDMSKVTFVDSAGLGALLSAMKQITTIGGSLRLADLNDDVLTLFRLVRMNRVFEIFDNVEEAIANQD
jgi:anti-sigma B factor antagonist